MFQFRAFPAYTYLIQCTLTRYCRAGFPHSEISGSMRMCRSPKLIAACRVLHRLLMPRHSPCALISLTFVRENCALLRPPQAAGIRSLRSLFLFDPNPLALGFGSIWFGERFVSLTSGSQNYAGHRRILTRIVVSYPIPQ